MAGHGQPQCKQQLCCCHILTQPLSGGRSGSLLSHSHGLLNEEEQKWPQATCLMGQEHGIAGSREPSQDPGRPQKKPSILCKKNLGKYFSLLPLQVLPVGTGREGSQDALGRALERKSCLPCSVATPLCANHGLHTLEWCDPKASIGYTPQPRWQQKAKGRIKQSHNLCRAVQQAGIQQQLLAQDRKCFWL